MDNIQILILEDSSFTLLDVYSLIKEVFSDRKTEGIDFGVSKCTFEEYKAKIDKDKKTIFVAIDINSGVFLGTAALTIHQDKKGRKYGGMTNCAVKRDSQMRNIGSKLVYKLKEIASLKQCLYLKSTTAVNATSSVKWHLKNGYKICGLASGFNTTYYSYVFQMPLNNYRPLYYRVGYKFSYFFSWIKTKSLVKQEGSFTWFGKLVNKNKIR